MQCFLSENSNGKSFVQSILSENSNGKSFVQCILSENSNGKSFAQCIFCVMVAQVHLGQRLFGNVTTNSVEHTAFSQLRENNGYKIMW